MSMKGVVLERAQVAILSLDGSLVYVEDVQPTHVAVVALPEQLSERSASCVFTAGRVGAKKISPYSKPDKIVPITELSPRNRAFIGEYEALRKQHGPNFVQRTPEEEAKMTVIKAGPAPRSRKSPEEKKKKRLERRANKVLCVKCGKAKIHADHAFGTCDFEGPPLTGRTSASGDVQTIPKAPRAAKVEGRYQMINTDPAKVQAENDKFKEGNRFFRVFRALQQLPESTGSLEDIMRAVAMDGARPMTNPEKVARRALKQLIDAGNVTRVS